MDALERTVVPADSPYGYGFCHCGCGERTSLEPDNNATLGRVRGTPRRYAMNHDKRRGWRILHEDRGYDSPCHIWQGSLMPLGYGQVRADGRTRQAHRVAYERERGPIPLGAQLDHICRVPRCVNPAHLEVVTNAENTRRGDRTRLTKADAVAIRVDKRPRRQIAAAYGVTPEHVGRIQRGCRWSVDMDSDA
jgi:hypothetical protein